MYYNIYICLIYLKKVNMLKKIFVLTIIILFACISSVSAFNISYSSDSLTFGETLYVGGAGPGNYTHIQDALDNATDGDTIFVYSGSYYEDIVIEKEVYLQGQDKNTTSIEGAGDEDDTVTICSDGVRISGFTLKNDGPYGTYSVIVFAQTNYSYIIGNSFVGDDSNEALFSSIYLVRSNHNVISGNTFSKGVIRAWYDCNYNEISYNTLDSTYSGILLYDSSNNALTHNIISGAQLEAIAIVSSSGNEISYNNIKNCNCGIDLSSNNCEITYNNFIFVKIKAKIYSNNNLWDHNYWGVPRFLPKLIIWFDFVSQPPPDHPYLEYHFGIDLHPARVPNEI
jgi:nitrous oxidase accessory protein